MGNANPNNFISKGPIFGVPLETAAERSDPFKLVPYVLRSSFAFLNAKGLDFEGLYRINGSKSQVNSLKEKFDKGERLNFLEIDKKKPVNPSNIASLKLPEPLLTKDLMEEFSKVTEKKDGKERIDYCKKLIAKLPPCNKQTLKLFMEHLVKVADNREVNHMTIDNLLLCITGASKNTPIYLVFLLNYEAIFLGVSQNSESHAKRKEYISYVISTTEDISKSVKKVEVKEETKNDTKEEDKIEIKEEKVMFGASLHDLEQLKLMLKDEEDKFMELGDKEEKLDNINQIEEDSVKTNENQNVKLVDDIEIEKKNIVDVEENVNSSHFSTNNTVELEESLNQPQQIQ